MDDSSEAEEALHCTSVADSIRKLIAKMTILTKLVPAWQKQYPYQLAIERGHVTTDTKRKVHCLSGTYLHFRSWD